mmetsp:Transcript_15000/g.40225  ORF Transcript_15000/g.40225 Transcript_15000/m.40225 type:complete len:202 (-) Transcript_15000:831-1436(-)
MVVCLTVKMHAHKSVTGFELLLCASAHLSATTTSLASTGLNVVSTSKICPSFAFISSTFSFTTSTFTFISSTFSFISCLTSSTVAFTAFISASTFLLISSLTCSTFASTFLLPSFTSLASRARQRSSSASASVAWSARYFSTAPRSCADGGTLITSLTASELLRKTGDERRRLRDLCPVELSLLVGAGATVASSASLRSCV